ncbi:UMP kinase [Candidatus Uhrbacteria bacterium]|nr:UMP kinase [Candidatus Uhrbacteria bacterium]
MPKLHLAKHEPIIFSLGGSLIAPAGGPDAYFLKAFHNFIVDLVRHGHKVVMICGGGRTSRNYIGAASEVAPIDPEDLDWLGIHATRLNGHLLRTIFRGIAHPQIIKNPMRTPTHWKEKVLVAAGWKPGWSTDYVASRIAGVLGIKHIVNASNIEYVFTADPKKDRNAKPVKEMTWHEYRTMVGDAWDPGLSAPFDPVASKYCQRHGIQVAIVDGRNIVNLEKVVEGKEFKGTLLS